MRAAMYKILPFECCCSQQSTRNRTVTILWRSFASTNDELANALGKAAERLKREEKNDLNTQKLNDIDQKLGDINQRLAELTEAIRSSAKDTSAKLESSCVKITALESRLVVTRLAEKRESRLQSATICADLITKKIKNIMYDTDTVMVLEILWAFQNRKSYTLHFTWRGDTTRKLAQVLEDAIGSSVVVAKTPQGRYPERYILSLP